MHLIDEGIEAVGRPRTLDFRTVGNRKQRRMLGKPEIDQAALLKPCRLGIRPDQRAVFVKRLDLPDEVVTALHAAQHRIEFRQAGGGDKGWPHLMTP